MFLSKTKTDFCRSYSRAIVRRCLRNVTFNRLDRTSACDGRSSHEYSRIMLLPSWSLCCLWHHRPQRLNHAPLILIRYPWLCSRAAGSSPTYHLTPFMLNVITTSFPCILPLVVYPKALFSFSSCTLPPQYSDLVPFPQPPSLCRWDSALLLFPPTQLWLKYF